ncbi:MAG TPA: hypothetical protein VGQ59_10415 [Cyclobacteriaceae bacterium]|nr:hypothetical protein [Cyclobacteriaceae bacterium]
MGTLKINFVQIGERALLGIRLNQYVITFLLLWMNINIQRGRSTFPELKPGEWTGKIFSQND